MPDLPAERVSEGTPIVTTGVDFAGPLNVKSHVTTESNDKVKAYNNHLSLHLCINSSSTSRAH